jgi:RimJ/RimL family protein N-acetyltransferase
VPSRSLAHPEPPLEDGVVRLRALRLDDAALYAAAFVDDPQLGFLAGEDPDPDEAAVRRRIVEDGPEYAVAGQGIEFAVAACDDDRFLGSAILFHLDWRHLRGEIGFWLVPAARGRGVAARAVDLLVGWAFGTLELQRLWLETYPDNVATRRVAERAGFVEEGLLRSHARERGRRMSLVVYGRLSEP